MCLKNPTLKSQIAAARLDKAPVSVATASLISAARLCGLNHILRMSARPLASRQAKSGLGRRRKAFTGFRVQ